MSKRSLMRMSRLSQFSARSHPPFTHWVALLMLSALLVFALHALHLPAALLLGPLAAAVAFAAAETTVQVPQRPFYLAQAVIGCMIGRVITPSLFAEVGRDGPMFLAAVVSVVAASSVLGWALSRWRILPGSTAIWGTSPGAATAMTLMAEVYGADVRLVAFMQYSRVVLVAVVATLVSQLWAPPHVARAVQLDWFPPIHALAFAQTLGLVAMGAMAGRLLRIPAGPLLVPIALGALLQDTGLVTIELPPWLLAISYALVGWNIGLRFTRSILRHAVRVLPWIVGSILALIAVCGGFAVLLVGFAGIDPLTAYLATSPGGADTVAIIAASSKVDLPFVMALQTARFVLVVIAGPSLARLIAHLSKADLVQEIA